MRVFAILIAATAIYLGAHDVALAQATTPNVVTPPSQGVSTPTSTVTNCMMSCNSQAASCQTTCLIPGTPPTGAATATGNANQNTACQLSCSTQQVNCQTICGRTSPSP